MMRSERQPLSRLRTREQSIFSSDIQVTGVQKGAEEEIRNQISQAANLDGAFDDFGDADYHSIRLVLAAASE